VKQLFIHLFCDVRIFVFAFEGKCVFLEVLFEKKNNLPARTKMLASLACKQEIRVVLSGIIFLLT